MRIQKISKIKTYKSARNTSRNAKKLPGRDGAVNVTSLRERHNLKHSKKESEVKFREVVVMKGEERNRVQWNIGIITDVYPGKDGKVRAVKPKAGRCYFERVVQLPYPLEISCDITPSTEEPTMNVNAEEFRPKRKASEIVQTRITELANDEMEEPLNE